MTVGSDWVRRMEDASRSSLSADATSWANAERAVRVDRARMEELSERVESRGHVAVGASPQRLKEEVNAAILQGRFHELNRRRLRIAANLQFEIPTAKLKDLVAARPESHAMLLEAFCNRWTDHRDHPRRRELAEFVKLASRGNGLSHRGRDLELTRRDAPVYMVGEGESELTAVLARLHERFGCRPTWQFTSEAVAAWIEITVSKRSAVDAWAQLKESHRAATRVLPALQGRTWVDGWPAGGGTAPSYTQITVVIALLRGFIERQCAVGDAFIDKLLRFSRFGDPRLLPLSEYWKDLRARDRLLFDEFSTLLVREDLALFFQHAMREKEREEFWLHYLHHIRRTIPVLSKDTRAELRRVLGGNERGQSVLKRTRVAERGSVSAFCLVFDHLVVVEFSDTGNAAYFYRREAFELQVFPEHMAVAKAVDLKRPDLEHDRLLHGPNWQIKAVKLLREYGVNWPEGNGTPVAGHRRE
jgi:hypothetical protein